jgi:hypothetical protein
VTISFLKWNFLAFFLSFVSVLSLTFFLSFFLHFLSPYFISPITVLSPFPSIFILFPVALFISCIALFLFVHFFCSFPVSFLCLFIPFLHTILITFLSLLFICFRFTTLWNSWFTAQNKVSSSPSVCVCVCVRVRARARACARACSRLHRGRFLPYVRRVHVCALCPVATFDLTEM